MKNLRAILLQIIDVMGLAPWKDGEVNNFLAFAQVGATVDLICHFQKSSSPEEGRTLGMISYRIS